MTAAKKPTCSPKSTDPYPGPVVDESDWSRSLDILAVAGVVNALSSSARTYFAAGGLDIVIGGSQLPHYSAESIVEAYYSAQMASALVASTDYQFIVHPAYNDDRGPFSILSVCLPAQG